MASPSVPPHYSGVKKDSNESVNTGRYLQRPTNDIPTSLLVANNNNNSTIHGNNSHHNSNNSNNNVNSSGNAGGGNREVEQRLARVAAEYEYKLLEERGRAQERESRLREELQRLSQQQQKQLVTTSASRTTEGGGAVSTLEYEKLQQQLSETRELLQEAERRYQQEKRELLNLRTAQLRNETSKRGQEGDIIGRAMQVMSEYEAVVRSSEESSLARLAHHMETFEKEWIRRAREFEEQKLNFETVMAERTRQALSEHQEDVESISRALLEKTTQMLRGQSDARIEMEEQVMRHAETFKEEYKAVLEKEFYDRCRMYDEKLAERERGWVKVLQEERKRIVAAEQRAVQEHETLHVQALEDAMRDLSRLREQLVREHQEQQTDAMKDLLTRREALQRDHDAALAQLKEEKRSVREECVAAVDAVREEMTQLQKATAAKEAEWVRQCNEAEQKTSEVALRRADGLRAEIEQQWSTTLTAAEERFANAIADLTREHQRTLAKLREERAEREGALLATCERRLAEADAAAEERWGSRVEEVMRSLEQHMQLVQELRGDNDVMSTRIATLTHELELRAAEVDGAASRARQESELQWHQRIETMRQRYDALLDEALGGADGRYVGRADYDAVVASVHEWEEKCVALRRDADARVAAERESVNVVWAKRLEEERADRLVWEAQRLEQLASEREALTRDLAAAKEAAARSVAAQREAADVEVRDALAAARTRSDSAIAAVEMAADERIAAAQSAAEASFAERVVALEARETALVRQQAKLSDEVQREAMAHVQRERDAMAAEIDTRLAKLREEEQEWTAKCAFAQERLAMEYESKFSHLREDMTRRLVETATLAMERHSANDALWLRTRAEEMALVTREREAFARLMRKQRDADVAAARSDAEGLLRRERDALERRESDLREAHSALQVAAEARATRLAEAHRETLREAVAAAEKEDSGRWDQLQRALAESARTAEAERRTALAATRREWDAVLAREREQWRSEAAQASLAADQRGAELAQQHEAALHALRLELHEAHAEMQRRADAMGRERDAAVAAEGRRLTERHEAQRRAEAEASRRAQREAEAAAAESNARHLVELDRRHQRELKEREAELERQRAGDVKALQDELQQSRLVAQREADAAREAFRVEMANASRAAVAAEAEKALSAAAEQEAAAQRAGAVYRDSLVALRAEMERSLAAHAAAAERRAAEAAMCARAAFDERLRDGLALLEAEEERRGALEAQLRAAESRADGLRLSHEQQRLAALREVEERYERLFAEMHEATRREREEWARRALGEEERRLLREVASREAQRTCRRGPTPASPKAWVETAANLNTPFRAAANANATAVERSASVEVEDDKLRQLWSVLEVPEAEQMETMRRWAQLPLAQRTEEMRKETRRLELQLPLLEVVTRREFVMHRLREIEKRASVEINSGSHSGGSSNYVSQMEEMRREMRRLTEHLRSEIPRHEAMYGNTFRFRGVRYMDTILGETSQLHASPG